MATQNGPLFTLPSSYSLDVIGVACPGATLEFFLTASDTEAPVYSDGELQNEVLQPVGALDDGTWPALYMSPTLTYRVVWTGPPPADELSPGAERYTWDPVKYGWQLDPEVFFDEPFEYLGTGVSADQIIGIYTAVRPQRIPGNFDGTGAGFKRAWGNVIIPPVAEVDVFCYLNNVTSKGYMRIATDGTVDFFTVGGTSFDLDEGEFITWRSQDTDGTIEIIGWTITGLNL